MDTSAHYIGMLETQSKFPSPEMTERLAAALNIDSTDLFRGDIKPDETIKSLQKAILADMGDLVGNFVSTQIKNIDERTGKGQRKKG